MKRIFSFILSFVIICSCMSGISFVAVNATTYVPRLTAPSTTNPYYLHTSAGGVNECIIIGNGSVLPNCVGYAWGRAYEILGRKPNLSKGNAKSWYNYNKNGAYYSYGSTPKVGSVVCWGGGTYGHVAVVEQVKGDTVTISQSSYGGARFNTITGTQRQIEGRIANFHGYIYLGDFNNYPDGIIAFGYDYPTEGAVINSKDFTFQGWVETTKTIKSITCSINDGQYYFSSSIYNRPDVPNATAFLATIPTSSLSFGDNKVAVCVNYTDGTGVVAGYKTVTKPRSSITCALDSPAENMAIETSSFKFRGWVKSDKEIKSIVCNLNDEKNFDTTLYKREDVPEATAYLAEINSDELYWGENKVSVCVNYTDGTSETALTRKVQKKFEYAIDYPANNTTVSEDTFLFQGWILAEKEISKLQCVINNEYYADVLMYVREDVPDADSFRGEIPAKHLNKDENHVSLAVTYSDGTSVILGNRVLFRDMKYTYDIPDANATLTYKNISNGIIITNCSKDANGDIVIPDSINNITVSAIDDKAFENCMLLENIRLSNGITELGENCFSGCTNLKSVVLPDTVTKINKSVFDGCYNLECVLYGGTKNDWNKIDFKDGGFIYNYVLIHYEGTEHNYKNIDIKPYKGKDGYTIHLCDLCGHRFKDTFEVFADTDSNGVVDINDVTAIQKHIAALVSLDKKQQIKADVNSDGKVNIRDATMTQLYLTKKIEF